MASAADPRERYEEVVRLIAHDLRNPLSAVQLTGQLIEQASALAGHEKQRRWARVVVEAARRMDDMVGKLVEAERIRSGALPLLRQTVALTGVLPDVVAGLAPEGAKARVVLPAEAVYCSGDRARIGQALAVLLRLAGQEVDPGREVVVEVWARGDRVGCAIRAPRALRPSDGNRPDGASVGAIGGRNILEHFARTVVECHDGTMRTEAADEAFGYEVTFPAAAAP